MRTKIASLVMPFVVACACACGGSAPADEAAEEDAIGTAPSDADPFTYGAPQVATSGHYWDTIVVQNEVGFDGVLVFGRTSPDAEPDQLVLLDRRTGALLHLSSSAQGDDPAVIAAELQEAGAALDDADAAQSIGTRDFVTPDNACFIKYASEAVLVAGALIAAPFVAEGAVSLEAGIERIAQQGLRTVATELLQAAWASRRFKALLAFKIVKDGLKGWLLFSQKGQELTAPVRRQISMVVHAKCAAPRSTDPSEGLVVGL
jgi:hypothetical protein